jgi:hypothetical protein
VDKLEQKKLEKNVEAAKKLVKTKLQGEKAKDRKLENMKT